MGRTARPWPGAGVRHIHPGCSWVLPSQHPPAPLLPTQKSHAGTTPRSTSSICRSLSARCAPSSKSGIHLYRHRGTGDATSPLPREQDGPALPCAARRVLCLSCSHTPCRGASQSAPALTTGMLPRQAAAGCFGLQETLEAPQFA